jgi:hypothetical protein
MEIQPLCPELIAKLEIAVAHRNRERAVAVVERYFEELDKPRPKGLDTPLADILPMRQASLLAKEGYLLVSDLAGVSEADLVEIKGIGKQLIAGLREKLNQRLHSKSG